MRNDGNITVYVLQARSQEPGNKSAWFSPSFDHFGTPPGFTASDDCWQQTGLHAIFHEAEGMRAMVLMTENHIEYDWRLMRLELSQHHYEVAQMSAKNPGTKAPRSNSYPEASDYELRRRALAIAKG